MHGGDFHRRLYHWIVTCLFHFQNFDPYRFHSYHSTLPLPHFRLTHQKFRQSHLHISNLSLISPSQNPISTPLLTTTSLYPLTPTIHLPTSPSPPQTTICFPYHPYHCHHPPLTTPYPRPTTNPNPNLHPLHLSIPY